MADEIRMPWDDLPVEVRRESQGWFGEPWPSGICYDDDGRLIEEMRKPVPVGEKCTGCDEPVQPGDQGKTCGAVELGGVLRPAHIHKECLMRDVLGPLAHIDGKCHHFGGEGNSMPGMTVRQEALEIWRRLEEGTLYRAGMARGAKDSSEEAGGVSTDGASPVIIHCPHYIAFEREIIMRPCRFLYGHDGECVPGTMPWGDRKRVPPDRRGLWAEDPRLWMLNLDHGWPVLAHLVTASEAGKDGRAVAHTTACGHRYTMQFTFGQYMTSVCAGGLLPLAEGSIHCGRGAATRR